MIRKALTYFVVITAFLYGARALHYKGLLKQEKGYYAKYKTAFLEKNKFDVLFLGSSRCEMHYNTKVFDSLTGKNSFNLSLAGATPRIAYAVLKIYLHKSKAPKELFYEVDYHFLKYDSPEIKDFNNFFPFLADPVVRKEFSKIDPRMKHFYLNPYYSFPFTGYKNLSTSLHGWLNIPNKTDSLYYKGHLREVFRPYINYTRAEKYTTWIHVSERNYLDSIIQLCKSKNIQISLISSPIFGGGKINLKNKAMIIRQLKNIAEINGTSFTDLSSLHFCSERKLFVDHYHMNAFGAEKFTTYFALFYYNKSHHFPLK